MPALNRTITLRPVDAFEIHPSSHWNTTTSPEGTLQAGDMTKVVKALTAGKVDGSPWVYGDAAQPDLNKGLVRANSINPGQTAKMTVSFPQLRDDPNEYISRIIARWFGSRGGSASNFAQTMWIRPAGFDPADGWQADVSGVAQSSGMFYNEHILAAPTHGSDVDVRRAKAYSVEWAQTNTAGVGSANGWTLGRIELVFEMALRNPLRSVG